MSRKQTQNSISIESAKQLSITTNTPPQIPSLTPRWLLKMLPWVNVENGIYRINEVQFIESERRHRVSMPENKDGSMLKDINFLSESMKQITLFDKMPEKYLDQLANAVEVKNLKPQEIVIKEGDIGDEFFIILDGKLEAKAKGAHGRDIFLNHLLAGDYFGELALLESVERKATIASVTKSTVACLKRSVFDEIITDFNIKKELDQIANDRRKKLSIFSQYGESQVPMLSAHNGEPTLPRGYADYNLHPKEIHLSIVQSLLGIHTRVTDLYNNPYDQLESQLKVVIQNIREREEWEIINNPEFGLLSNVSLDQVIDTIAGAPTPDDLDALIRLVWKSPSIFLAHPKAIEAFGRECTFRGVPPATTNMYGTNFLTWRGIPLVPSDKLLVRDENGVETTEIILMRLGENAQGVIGLHKNDIGSAQRMPSLSVQPMGIDDKAVANYLVTKYFSVAVLVPDAIGVLRNVKLNSFHNYGSE